MYDDTVILLCYKIQCQSHQALVKVIQTISSNSYQDVHPTLERSQ